MNANDETTQYASWLAMVIILMAQMQMGFNVNALVISMGAIVDDLNTSATTVGTALVVYSLAVAGLVMLGAKIGGMIGSRLAFQVGIAAHGASMLWMALSPNAEMMIAAQAVAGVAAALAVPALVVLIAANYSGKQQEQSLGLLAAAVPASGVLAFLIVGVLTELISWRWTFAALAVVSVAVLVLSVRLSPIERQSGERIDWIGAILAASAITLISLGFNSVNAWGLLVAGDAAPFEVLGLSPVPIFIFVGIVLIQAFFAWMRRQRAHDKPQLFEMEVLDSREEVHASISLLLIGALAAGVNFLIPLYVQIVQGRTTLQTAVAIVPYALAVLVSAILVVRLYDRFPPRQIGRVAFVAAAAGLLLLAYTIQNDWGTPLVILSLIVIGLGEGSLLTLLFNVLVSASPKRLAGHVGALRGTINNLATGLGTAIASVLAVASLGLLLALSFTESPAIPDEVVDYMELDDVDFVGNDELEEALEDTTLTPEVADEVVRINSEARLTALKISFQVLAGLALLGIFPAGRLPAYVPGEVPTKQERPSRTAMLRKRARPINRVVRKKRKSAVR
ncbi:MAG TPA: MFS transporter [Thermomicrobiales bacterium]|nr:MFS transporter [Thermomicrobiales bacterium]